VTWRVEIVVGYESGRTKVKVLQNNLTEGEADTYCRNYNASRKGVAGALSAYAVPNEKEKP
jgi:hypothetical protein